MVEINRKLWETSHLTQALSFRSTTECLIRPKLHPEWRPSTETILMTCGGEIVEDSSGTGFQCELAIGLWITGAFAGFFVTFTGA